MLIRLGPSYYNGTTKVRIEPRDIEDVNGRSCATAGRPVEFTLEKALLAVVKSNRYIEQQNDFTFSLAFWDESLGESRPRRRAISRSSRFSTLTLCPGMTWAAPFSLSVLYSC